MNIEKQQKKMRKAYGLTRHNPSKEALAMRPNGKGWQCVITEDGEIAWARIRKLTPRECFRLMDVSEANINKIQEAAISDSQQYKMAGNSIVVACMAGIFHNLFIDDEVQSSTLF